jgi:DNA repair exonuclease SbcCD ATPase subunit
MKTQQQASIESLQFEIDNLIAQKQQLEALPKVISDPLKYAQSVAQKVAESAPKVRQIDALIDGLQTLIKQRTAETEEEQQRLKAEQDKAELNGILKDFKALGDKLDAIARIEAKALLELRELHAAKSNRLWQLTHRQIQFDQIHELIDNFPVGESRTPGLVHYGVKIATDGLVVIEKRSDRLQSLLEG